MDNLCRLCYENKGFQYIFNEKLEINSKIMYCCTRIIIRKDDGLPSTICSSCNEELEKVYEFVQKCESTDRKLHTEYIKFKPQNVFLEVKLKSEDIDNNPSSIENVEDNDCETDILINFEPVSNHELNDEVKQLPIFFKKCKKSETFSCSVCGQTCTNKSALNIHLRKHNTEAAYRCLDCEKNYKDAAGLKRHRDRHHSERKRSFICEHCGKGFYTKYEVKIHMRTHTGETPYSCTECLIKFTQISALLRHKRRHSGVKPYLCSTCPKKFFSKEELKLHLKVHSNEKNYQCSLCKTLFKYQNNLRKHLFLHSDPKSFICNYCGKTFNTKGNLKTHIDRQHSEKSGYCNICSKDMPNIEVHMWKHNGQRPLKCQLCTSTFFEKKALTHHVNYHHKNCDKFKCSVIGCSLTFPSQPMLSFHFNKVHENKAAFPCDKCSRGFYRKNDLARHKIGTHKERL